MARFAIFAEYKKLRILEAKSSACLNLGVKRHVLEFVIRTIQLNEFKNHINCELFEYLRKKSDFKNKVSCPLEPQIFWV